MDIGANTGDTSLILAVAARGGTVVAFEMGSPVEMLRVNKRCCTLQYLGFKQFGFQIKSSSEY